MRSFRHALFGGIVSSVSWLCQVALLIINTILTCWPRLVNNKSHRKMLEIILPNSFLKREAVRSIQVRKCLKSILWCSSHSNMPIVSSWKPDSFRRVEIASRFPIIICYNQLKYKRNNRYLYFDYVAFDLYLLFHQSIQNDALHFSCTIFYHAKKS
jgi:hypothetical protein